MKAVLLARGLGRRMRQDDGCALTASQAAAAAAGAKGMMPIGTRPFLDFVLSALADAGCTDVCLVVSPEHAQLRDYYAGAGRPARLRMHYAIQRLPDGTAHAVLSAEAFAGGDPFFVLNSDNLYPTHVLRALAGLGEPGLPAFERASLIDDSGFPADRVAAFAAIETDSAGYVTRIVEKPGQAYYDHAGPRALVSMNLWRFDARIFDACRDVPVSVRGEYELPEAVALLIARGTPMKAFVARGAVLDLSRRSDVALVADRLGGVVPQP